MTFTLCFMFQHALYLCLRLLIAGSAFIALAHAQTAPSTPLPACLQAHEIKADQLHGRWLARFTGAPAGLPNRATVVLQRHAEFSESLAGTVTRVLPRGASSGHALRAALAGDLDDGLLLLDESSDNIAITGTWNGEMLPGSCGRTYRGVWKDTSKNAPENAPDVAFTLSKLP